MWDVAFPKIKAGNIAIDHQIDNLVDNRRGITLLIRFNPSTLSNMTQFLEKTKLIAPDQYYYPKTDLHLTTLSIFSCQAGFQLDQINLISYQQILKNTLQNFSDFPLVFEGITLSTSGVVAKGYDTSGTLNKLRDAIRIAFKKTDLAHSIDHRYVLKAAHSTLLRFKNPLVDSNNFLNFLEKHKTIHLGKMEVSSLDLVFNDWYMKIGNVRLLDRYFLHNQ